MLQLKWGKMSKPTPVGIKGIRNLLMKLGAILTSAAGALSLFLIQQGKISPVPDYAWHIVYVLGSAGIICSTVFVPFFQSYYLEDASVSKK